MTRSAHRTLVYYECGLLDEKEFTAWIGLTPQDKEFNGKKGKDREIMPVLTCDEEGNYKEFYLVSLEGMQIGDVLGMRKTQFQYYVDIIMDEHHVPAGCQLSREQPRNWFEFAGKDHFRKHRGMTIRPTSSGGEKQDKPPIYSMSQLISKANSIIAERERAEAGFGFEGSGLGDSQDSLDDLDQIDAGKAGGPQHARLDSTYLGGIGPSSAPKTAPKKGTKARAKKKGEEDEDMEGESAAGSSARMLELNKNDPELAVVAKKHEKLTGRAAPKSFENLRVGDVFVEGNKAKQSLYGARKALETLSSENCLEAHVLKNRVAKVDAACKLHGADLQTMPKIEMKQCLGVLKGDLRSIPLTMRLQIVTQTFQWKFQDIASILEEPDQLQAFFLKISFWTKDCVLPALEVEADDSGGIDFDSPSLIPLVSEVIHLDESVATDFFDDDVEKTNKLAVEARWEALLWALKNSNETITEFGSVCAAIENSDFAVSIKGLHESISETESVLSTAAALLSDNILVHCLKTLQPGSEASQSEKNKKRNLLVSQMGKVKDKVFGQAESMLHPVISAEALKVMKPSQPSA
eukprot:Skav201194  [mRNA]  locus=scaffold633:304690:311323:- [translate_table: standard]